MLMAVDAGVHILSMSVGETNPWSDDREPKVKLLNAITAKGIHGNKTYNQNSSFIRIPNKCRYM